MKIDIIFIKIKIIKINIHKKIYAQKTIYMLLLSSCFLNKKNQLRNF